MKLVKFLFFLFLFLYHTSFVSAETCCEAQGGLSGSYNEEGYAICKDETPSYDEKCRKAGISKKPPADTKYRKGCTDKNAKNYSERAQVDDGSCTYYIYGCTQKDSFNYNEKAEIDDGSCQAKKEGCMNSKAINYDKDANIDNKTCEYEAIIVKEEKIPFQTIYVNNKKLLVGEEKVIEKGAMGMKKVKYRIVINDLGKEIKKEKLDEKIITASKNQRIEEGSKDSMLDFTLLLYGLGLLFLLFDLFYLHKHPQTPSLLIEIQNISFSSFFLTFLIKMVAYFLYFLFSLSILEGILFIVRFIKRKV